MSNHFKGVFFFGLVYNNHDGGFPVNSAADGVFREPVLDNGQSVECNDIPAGCGQNHDFGKLLDGWANWKFGIENSDDKKSSQKAFEKICIYANSRKEFGFLKKNERVFNFPGNNDNEKNE